MPDGKTKQAVEAYFTDPRPARSSGGAIDGRSLYVPPANLLGGTGERVRVNSLGRVNGIVPGESIGPHNRGYAEID